MKGCVNTKKRWTARTCTSTLSSLLFRQALWRSGARLLAYVCLAFPLAGLAQQEAILPEAPRAVTTVAGFVADQSGDPIRGARIAVANAPGFSETVTGEDGLFRIAESGLICDLEITAPGFATKSLRRENCDGPWEVGKVALSLEAGATEVEVTASRQEIAEEQIKVEMHQRILGVIPNFYVTYDPNAVPLDAKQKYKLAMRTIVDPETIGVDMLSAAVQQKTGTLGAYGSGVGGYTKQFAASYGTGSIDTLLGGAVFPSIFRQDPRYFYKGTGTVTKRALYAMSMSVLCKGNNGHWQYNYSGLMGGLAAGGIANLYAPKSATQGLDVMLGNTALGIGTSAITNLLQEFVIRKFTPTSRGGSKK
jgi:hypothetical protein